MADLLADIVGTCAASDRNLLARAMKAGAPLSAFLALIGDLFAGARRSYNAHLASGVEFIDPYLSYIDMLKVQDGLDGAREIVGAMQKTNHTVSLETAAALLLSKEQRAAALAQIIAQHPDDAPAVYLLSREYSAEKLGEQTIADERREKALLALCALCGQVLQAWGA